MIGKLKGTLCELQGNLALVDTASGLSYYVFVTPSIVKSSAPGKTIEIYTYLQIREDAQNLYGFAKKDEFKLFKLLLSISGIGPKTAFTIISHIKIEELYSAVKENDIAFFTAIPGLGKKTAMKVLLELSQKLDQEFSMEKMYISEEDKIAIDALVALGFKSEDAKRALNKIEKGLSIEEKISSCIKLLTKK